MWLVANLRSRACETPAVGKRQMARQHFKGADYDLTVVGRLSVCPGKKGDLTGQVVFWTAAQIGTVDQARGEMPQLSLPKQGS